MARPVLSPQQYACALHPWEAPGRLPGRTECDHAPNQWTPRLSEHPSTGRSSSIIFAVLLYVPKKTKIEKQPGAMTFGSQVSLPKSMV